MSFANLCGDSACADARLLALDGFIIPFHRIIFEIAPHDRQLKNCDFKLYINSQYQDATTPIPLVFDAQTVWRLLCFIYDGTYQDEDKDLTFSKVEPLDFPPSANTLGDEPLEHQEVELIRGLHNLHITAQSCKSEVLVKALNSVKVFRAAFMWNLDRLMVEAAHRFGEFISGAFNQPEFPQIIAPVFNSVVDPQCMLYGHLVQECFAHCQELVNNDKFIVALEHNGKLAVHLYERVAKLQASLGRANVTELPQAPSVPESSGRAPVVDSSAITLLQSQLAKALNAATSKKEQVDALKQEVAHLKTTCTEVTASDSAKQERIDALEQEAALKENAPRKASIDLEARIQKLLAQRNTKDAVIDNLEHQLEEKDRKIAELDRNLAKVNGLNTTLSQQINKQRVGKPDNTNLLVERNEALENAGKLQARITEFEDKVKELEDQLATHAKESISVNTAFATQPPTRNGNQHSRPLQSASRAQDAEPRRDEGFGSMADSVNAMIAASSGEPTRLRSPLLNSPVPAASTPTTKVPIAGGAPTFIQKQREMKKRREAAGITGGDADVDAPSNMPTIQRRESIFCFPGDQILSPSPTASVASIRSLANGVPIGPHAALARRGAGPHLPQPNGGVHAPSPTAGAVAGQPHTNGITQHTTPRPNGSAAIPIVDPARAVPATLPHVARIAPVVPAAATNGNSASDSRDATITFLQKRVVYLENQLTDARTGPNPKTQSGPSPAHGYPNARHDDLLVRVLKALGDYCVDHRACNDCGINFNAQFRGIVENIEDHRLILKCGKCDTEKCNLLAVADNTRRR